MSFPNVMYGSEEEATKTYTAERWPLGSKMEVEDGRIFRMAEAGATALVESRMQQAEAPITAYTDEAVATLAAGVTVLTGVGSSEATNAAVNLLKNGYVYCSTIADQNPAMRIKSNTLITAGAATGTITLYNPTTYAIAAATTISYFKNLWKDIIVQPATTPTATSVGVPLRAIAADAFGWVQTRGVCRVLVAGTHVIGNSVTDSGVAGAVGPNADATPLGPIYGHVIFVEADTEAGPVFLTLE